jgi:hypothetical protein
VEVEYVLVLGFGFESGGEFEFEFEIDLDPGLEFLKHNWGFRELISSFSNSNQV